MGSSVEQGQAPAARSKRRIAAIVVTFLVSIGLATFALPYSHPHPPSITVRRIGPHFGDAGKAPTKGEANSFPTPPVSQQPVALGPRDCRHTVTHISGGAYSTGESSDAQFWANDPSCGPLRFTPSPDPNREMTLDVKVSPSMPRVGQNVTFRITAEDPDARISERCPTVSYGENLGGQHCGISLNQCPVFYGTWNPPAPGAPDRNEFEFRIVYREPGPHTAVFDIHSGSGYKPFCGFPNPYSDIVRATVKLVVVP